MNNQETYDYLKELIKQRKESTNWDNLPADFEMEAVTILYIKINPFLRDVIKARINASKALTFDELLISINEAQDEFSKKMERIKR